MYFANWFGRSIRWERPAHAQIRTASSRSRAERPVESLRRHSGQGGVGRGDDAVEDFGAAKKDEGGDHLRRHQNSRSRSAIARQWYDVDRSTSSSRRNSSVALAINR